MHATLLFSISRFIVLELDHHREPTLTVGPTNLLPDGVIIEDTLDRPNFFPVDTFLKTIQVSAYLTIALACAEAPSGRTVRKLWEIKYAFIIRGLAKEKFAIGRIHRRTRHD